MTHLYNCKREINGNGETRFRITKFDSNMEVESSYLTDGEACECPAGERYTCRHREMLPKFLARDAVNTNWLYDFDRGGWVQMYIDEASNIPDKMWEATEDITILDLSKTSPETLFNTLADALGEPRIDSHPNTGKASINRRGF